MWHPVVVRRDKPGFLKPFERTISEHLSEELNKLEQETSGQIVASIVVEDTEYDMEVVVKVEGEQIENSRSSQS